MRKRVPDEATCAICGRHFDPSETRGWCPNPSCGEWQHPSFPIEASPEEGDVSDDSESESGKPGSTKTCPECGNEVRADARFCKHCANPFDEAETPRNERAATDSTETADSDVLECPDCGADLSNVPTDRLSRCPICMFDLAPVLDDADEDSELDRAELTECPNCGEDLSPIPSEMRTVCPGCRVDLDEGVAADARGTDRGAPDPTTTAEDRDAGSAPIEAVDAVATGYEPRLKESGVTTVDDLLEANPDELSTKTGISARRIRGWTEEVSRGTEKPVTDPTATGDDPDFEATRIQRPSDELVLEVMGQSIPVTDGQTVGSEIRSAMVEAGASEQDAVYVHRKHVRIDAEDDEFVLTRLGENSLEVNGRSVEKGSQIPIRDGDEITFSDVVTATVSVR